MPTFDIENVETKKSWSVHVDGDRFFIGRSPRAEVRLRHSSISRQHLLVERQGDTYHFVDLCSTNGTMVNKTLHRQGPLAEGDVLLLGAFRLRFSSATSASAAPKKKSADSKQLVDAQQVAAATPPPEAEAEPAAPAVSASAIARGPAPARAPTPPRAPTPAPALESMHGDRVDFGDPALSPSEAGLGVWAFVILIVLLSLCLGLGIFLGHLSALLD